MWSFDFIVAKLYRNIMLAVTSFYELSFKNAFLAGNFGIFHPL